MDAIRDLYEQALGEHGDSAAAVLCPKGRQDLRFERLLAYLPPGGRTLVDFGCGLAHLFDYLKKVRSPLRYSGVDISDKFLQAAVARQPELKGSLFLLEPFQKSSERFDYTLCSGTFNLKYLDDDAKNLEFVFNSLSELFERSNLALTANFMTDHVDFVQDGAFHLSPSTLLDEVRRRFGRRYILDSSYMPYEYSITIYKDDTIRRPDNVFAAIEE